MLCTEVLDALHVQLILKKTFHKWIGQIFSRANQLEMGQNLFVLDIRQVHNGIGEQSQANVLSDLLVFFEMFVCFLYISVLDRCIKYSLVESLYLLNFLNQFFHVVDRVCCRWM